MDVITWQCLNTMAARKKAWSPPQKGWLKFNIGVDWSVRNQRGRAAWVLRDTSGRVLLMSPAYKKQSSKLSYGQLRV